MLSFGYRSIFSCRLRALAMIAIGAVLVFADNAAALMVQVVGALLIISGGVSLLHALLGRRDPGRRDSFSGAVVSLCIGLVLLFFSDGIAAFAIYLIAFALIIAGILQLITYTGAMSAAGLGVSAPIISGLIVLGGVLLLFNPFSINIMGTIAGIFLIIYGINELSNSSRVNRAITDNYGPLGEDKGVDEQ